MPIHTNKPGDNDVEGMADVFSSGNIKDVLQVSR
jgi:hypothetical protein